jgi:predicted RNA-binding Zn-ribbon protein involved in translation (DUF1610 family)
MTPRICPTSGKQQFSTEREAKGAMIRRNRRERRQTPGYAYRCPDCGWWHRTRVPPEKLKRRRAG